MEFDVIQIPARISLSEENVLIGDVQSGRFLGPGVSKGIIDWSESVGEPRKSAAAITHQVTFALLEEFRCVDRGILAGVGLRLVVGLASACDPGTTLMLLTAVTSRSSSPPDNGQPGKLSCNHCTSGLWSERIFAFFCTGGMAGFRGPVASSTSRPFSAVGVHAV
jgi:hypothetical protein